MIAPIMSSASRHGRSRYSIRRSFRNAPRGRRKQNGARCSREGGCSQCLNGKYATSDNWRFKWGKKSVVSGVDESELRNTFLAMFTCISEAGYEALI